MSFGCLTASCRVSHGPCALLALQFSILALGTTSQKPSSKKKPARGQIKLWRKAPDRRETASARLHQARKSLCEGFGGVWGSGGRMGRWLDFPAPGAKAELVFLAVRGWERQGPARGFPGGLSLAAAVRKSPSPPSPSDPRALPSCRQLAGGGKRRGEEGLCRGMGMPRAPWGVRDPALPWGAVPAPHGNGERLVRSSPMAFPQKSAWDCSGCGCGMAAGWGMRIKGFVFVWQS